MSHRKKFYLYVRVHLLFTRNLHFNTQQFPEITKETQNKNDFRSKFCVAILVVLGGGGIVFNLMTY